MNITLSKRIDVLEAKTVLAAKIVICHSHAMYLAEQEKAKRRKRPTEYISVRLVSPEDGVSRGSDGSEWPGVPPVEIDPAVRQANKDKPPRVDGDQRDKEASGATRPE